MDKSQRLLYVALGGAVMVAAGLITGFSATTSFQGEACGSAWVPKDFTWLRDIAPSFAATARGCEQVNATVGVAAGAILAIGVVLLVGVLFMQVGGTSDGGRHLDHDHD